MLAWLQGKKELFVHAVTFLTTLATMLGLADFVAPLHAVSDAISAGNAQAILTAILVLAFSAASFFRRLGLNVQHAQLLRATTNNDPVALHMAIHGSKP